MRHNTVMCEPELDNRLKKRQFGDSKGCLTIAYLLDQTVLFFIAMVIIVEKETSPTLP